MFALTGDVPEAAGFLHKASALLGDRNVRDFVRSDAGEIHHNRTGQIICTVQAIAAAAALGDAIPGGVIVAGYSVGEVAAWGVAGVFTGIDTLDLVACRAEAMDAATQLGDGLMFILGLRREVIDELCDRYGAAVAIVNPGDAFVVGGGRSALRAVADEARAMHASRVIDLPVEVASHTARLADASVVFRDSLGRIPAEFPPGSGARVLSGIDGSPVASLKGGLDKLAAQISHPVQWANCLQGCIEAGATAFLELGPGHALSSMAASAWPDIPARSFDDFKSLQGVRSWLGQHAYR